jgi:hypothetical protein
MTTGTPIDTTTNTLSTGAGTGANRYRRNVNAPEADVAAGFDTSSFPSSAPELVECQARIWAPTDLWSSRFREHENAYVEGFVEGFADENAVDDYRRINMYDIDQDAFEAEARKAGRSRAAYMKLASETQFITQAESYFGENDYPFADRRLLHNAFTKGGELLVPKGTPFSSYLKGGVKGRAVRTTVESAGPGHLDGSYMKRYIRPATVTMVGSGGYYQEIIVTPELLRANNLPVLEAPNSGYLEMRKDER